MELIRLFGKMGRAQMEFMDQMDSVLKSIVPLTMPADGKFNYPTDKKRTKENHEAMIKAEANLDNFWAKFDRNYKRLTRKTIDTAMGDHISKHRGKLPERTPPWVEPIKEMKSTKVAFEPQSWDDSPDTKIEIKSKRKRKTRGVAQPEVEAAPELSKLSLAEAPSVQEDNQPIFKVNSAALKVFNILFYTPNQTNRPGEIPWRDFLQAMASTGFAIQKLYGSIWQFTPTTLDVERSIQFHEPHPGVKLPYTWARRIGRRLTLAYGWRGDMFELDEGSKQ
ncbi:hypothetical protein VTL71DRAFT_8832 [Oculimacula yallundae]|uniref:Uncharacterized protein n=1 Tax=Oculimacula yallundae TaxID=86028 RepID=A0ABR4CYV6_9HELO